MNSFTLDDIEYLVLYGRSRLDDSGEYDISYYEEYINENIMVIEELINNVRTHIDLIEDSDTKRGVLNYLKDLTKAYEINKNKHPKEEYNNSPYSVSFGAGYLQEHKYADFIQHDFHTVAKSYSKIIRFMNNAYQLFSLLEQKGDSDNRQLYSIFTTTKKACANLGVHCPHAYSLYDAITSDPYAEKSELLEMDFEIVDEDNLRDDVIITSLPYTVTAPAFTYKGPEKYELPVTEPRAKIWYNQSYFQNNLTIK